MKEYHKILQFIHDAEVPVSSEQILDTLGRDRQWGDIINALRSEGLLKNVALRDEDKTNGRIHGDILTFKGTMALEQSQKQRRALCINTMTLAIATIALVVALLAEFGK